MQYHFLRFAKLYSVRRSRRALSAMPLVAAINADTTDPSIHPSIRGRASQNFGPRICVHVTDEVIRVAKKLFTNIRRDLCMKTCANACHQLSLSTSLHSRALRILMKITFLSVEHGCPSRRDKCMQTTMQVWFASSFQLSSDGLLRRGRPKE